MRAVLCATCYVPVPYLSDRVHTTRPLTGLDAVRQLERLTGGGVEPGGGVGVDDCGDELLEVVVVEAVRRGAGGGVVLGVVDGGGKAGEAVEVAEEAVEDGGDGAGNFDGEEGDAVTFALRVGVVVARERSDVTTAVSPKSK